MCKVGNPINPATGNKFQKEIDYVGSGPFPIRWIRYYNSDGRFEAANPETQKLGVGWTHEYNRLVWTYGRLLHVMVFRPDGQAYEYHWDGQGSYNGPSDVPGKLFHQAGQPYELHTKDGTVEAYGFENFDRRWLSEIRGKDGSKITINRIGDGEITSIVDHLGRMLTVNTLNGYITSIIDPAGETFTYAHESPSGGEDVLKSVTYPGAGNPQKTYLYGESAFVSGSSDDAMKLTGIIDENGKRFATWKYDAEGRAYYSERAGSINAVTINNFSPPDGTSAFGTTEFTDANGVAETQTYEVINGSAKMSSTLNGQCALCGGRPKSATYDTNGYLESSTDDTGNKRYFKNDADGNQTCRLEGIPGNGSTFDNALRLVLTAWDTQFRVSTRVKTYAPVDPLMTPPVVCDDNPGAGTWTLRREIATALVSGSGRIDWQTERSYPTDTGNPPRTTDSTYYGEEGGDAAALAALHLIKRIDGPRTDITDTTECFYATVDDSHHRIGDLVEIRNALNHSTQVNKYDQHGRPTEIVDANGAVTTLTYPPRGWLTARTVDGQTTAFEYDDVGQLDRVTLPDGSYLDYDYDDARRLISIRDNANNQIAYELDTFGNRITETTFDPSATIVRQLDRVYDALNRLSKLVAGEGQTTAFQYDTNGNLITTIDPRDPFPDPANQNPQIFASNLYDALNRVRQTTDAKGGVTSFTYDVNDNVKGVVDPEGFVTAYTYNGFGELVRLVSPDTGQTDYLFDEAGNRTSTDDARPVGAIAYTYDELNRLISIDFPNDVDTVYGYDDTSVGTGCTSPRNAIGRLTSLSDESGSTDYFYDLRGNITCKERTIAGEAFIIRYTYDSADRIETLTYPSGQVVAYERNAAGQIHRMTTTFDSVTKTIVENIEHAPFGWPTAWQFGNQLQADLPIDLSYRTTSITHGAALDLSFGYDAADNIESITNVVAAGDSEAFQYDGNSRLIEAIGPYGEFDYAYDANGNRTSYIVDDDPAGTRSTTYTYYPNTNRLHENIAGSTYLSFDRDYDESGNTISRIPQSGNVSYLYEYGDDGRLAQVFRDHSSVYGDREINILKNGFGQPSFEQLVLTYRGRQYDRSRFIYDESGQLITERPASGDAWYEYIYLDSQLVGFFARKIGYVLDPGPPRRYVRVVSKDLYFVQTNHIGAPIVATDENRNVAYQVTAYKPFGGRTETVGSGFTYPRFRVGLPGQIDSYGDYTIYNHFREYDSDIGRYLQSDPIGLVGGINTYTYANNNPLRFADPLGLLTFPEIFLDAGVQASAMFGIGGLSLSATGAASTGGQICKLVTVCGRLGLGIFVGAGGQVSGGLVRGDTSGLAGTSIGIGGDIGAGPSIGGAVAIGLPGPSSGTVGKGKGGFGYGGSAGVDFCITIEEYSDASCPIQ